MRHICTQLLNDEAGFIVSAELILVSSIAVLSMIVGLSEVASSINNELNDVANAFGSINQSYCVRGFQGCKAQTTGSMFHDTVDQCDNNSIMCDNAPQPEGGSHGGHGRGW